MQTAIFSISLLACGDCPRWSATLDTAADVAALFVVLLHLWFMVLEMFLWTKPLGRRVFRLTEEKAQATKMLAANQGLYNGLLAAVLLWSIFQGHDGDSLRMFVLGCVIVAGVFGAATVGRKILFVQALPAAVALGLTWME